MIDNKGSGTVRCTHLSIVRMFHVLQLYEIFLLPNVCSFCLFPLNYHHAMSLEKKFLDP